MPRRGPICTEAVLRNLARVRVQYDHKKSVTENMEKQGREKKIEKRMREYVTVNV